MTLATKTQILSLTITYLGAVYGNFTPAFFPQGEAET